MSFVQTSSYNEVLAAWAGPLCHIAHEISEVSIQGLLLWDLQDPFSAGRDEPWQLQDKDPGDPGLTHLGLGNGQSEHFCQARMHACLTHIASMSTYVLRRVQPNSDLPCHTRLQRLSFKLHDSLETYLSRAEVVGSPLYKMLYLHDPHSCNQASLLYNQDIRREGRFYDLPSSDLFVKIIER